VRLKITVTMREEFALGFHGSGSYRFVELPLDRSRYKGERLADLPDSSPEFGYLYE
jgi:hypothetical protein